MSAKEYRFLMNNKKELNIDDLKDLLLENEISNFDPVAEAFKIFDSKGEGTLDESKLRAAFMSFGFGELSDEEFEILKRVSLISYFIAVPTYRSDLKGGGHRRRWIGLFRRLPLND